MPDLSQSAAWMDDLYGFFVVAMQRTGNTKEALRQTIRHGQLGLTNPEGGPASQNAEAAPPVARVLDFGQIPIERHWGVSMLLHNALGHTDPWEMCGAGCDRLASDVIRELFGELTSRGQSER